MDRRTLILLQLLLVFSSHALPQHSSLRFDHVSLRQGLSNFNVMAMAQDRQGFLWIGTEDGLNRYDGTQFLVYKHDPLDSLSLPSNGISSICVGRDGSVWIGTSRGLALASPQDLKPRRVRIDTGAGGCSIPIEITRVKEDKNGGLWLGTSTGILYRHPASQDFRRLSLRLDRPTFITAILESKHGDIWLGTGGAGIFRFRIGATSVALLPDLPNLHGTSEEGFITSLLEDKDGKIWIGTINGLNCFDPSNGFLTRYGTGSKQSANLPRDVIHTIFSDHAGTIWVGTFHVGLARHDPKTDSFVRYIHDPNDPSSLPNDRVICLCEDDAGIFWVANYRGGLSKHNPRTRAFTHYSAGSLPGSGLAENTTYAVLEDRDGDLWFGSELKGLTWYRPKEQKYAYFAAEPGRPETIRNNYVLALRERANGDIWIGTGDGLELLHKRTRSLTLVAGGSAVRHSPNEYSVKTILEDHLGVVWYGTLEGGLSCFDPRTGAKRCYRTDPQNPRSLGSDGVWSLCETQTGDLWIGTFGGGLNKYDRAADLFTRFLAPEDEKPGSLNNNAIYCIQEDPGGALWLGTYGGGLNRFDPRTGVFSHWTQGNGLPNNFVKGILRDSSGCLWLSTDNGLARFDPQTETFTNFSAEDGLGGDVFLSGCYFYGRSGEMYFGGEHGVTSFRPEKVGRNAHIPPVVVTGFWVDNDQRLPGGSPGDLVLRHDQNSVSIEFVALDFAMPARNQYAYMMEGVDRTWIQAGTRRDVRYTQMEPGEYVFRVKGSNADGVWNEAGAAVRFRISPPFWETLWFRLLAIVTVVAGAYLIYRYRVNRLLDVERLRVQIASDLHDDIGSSLTRIALQSELISEGFDPESVPRYLQSIATTSRELVTTMSDIVWSIDSRNDSVEHLIVKIQDFAADTLGAKQIQCSLTPTGLELHRKVPVDVRENIYLICKEAINNIAKHSDATAASITMDNRRERFVMVISDNGHVREGESRISGHGIRNMRMRAERLGGTCEITFDSGTRVVVELPPL